MARHAGVEITPEDWMNYGCDVPLLVNMQPAGKYLGERFHRAGGVPAVLCELLRAGKLDGEALTVTGRTWPRTSRAARATGPRGHHAVTNTPLQEHAGFLVLKGNLFDFAIMKTSVISEEFRQRYLAPGRESFRGPRGRVRRLGRLSRTASTIRRWASTSTPSW